jgi:ABC-type multidrug transport system ATPase subunit
MRLFSTLKGLSKEEAEFEINELLRLTELDVCIDQKANKISSGQLRKLCIALAFIPQKQFAHSQAKNQIIILDEPTAVCC